MLKSKYINSIPVIILALALLSLTGHTQSSENYIQDEAVQKLSKAYPLETRMEIAASEMELFLNNTDPVAAVEWVNLGPNTMDTLSGRAITMAIDPNNSNRLYIGSGSGGMWRSPNGGESWQSLTDAMPSPHVSAIAISPLNSAEILMGTGVGQVPTSTLSAGIGVLKSTDGGNTWMPTEFSFPQSDQVSVYDIVWHTGSNTVYLGATNGLYISEDGGSTWEDLLPDVRIYDIEVHPENPQEIFVAVMNAGIRKSVDGGLNWEDVNDGMPFGNQVFRSAITICETSPNNMYASLISNSGFGLIGVYKSTDGGDTWGELSGVPNFPCQPSDPSNCTGWLFHDIAVAPNNPDQVVVGSVQYYYSDNGGNTWVWRDYASNGSTGGNEGLSYVDTWKFQFHPTIPGVIYTCNDGGVQKSSDYGLNWVRLSEDLIIGQTYSIETRENDPEFIIGAFHDHGMQRLISSDENLTWTRWSLGDGIQSIIDPNNPNILYGNLQNGTPYKSVTMGDSHLTTFPITNGINESGPWITPLEIHPTESNILFTSSNNHLYRTINGGELWQSVLNINTVQSIAVNQINPDTIYAHAFNSTSWSFWRSHDAGATWKQIDAVNIPTWGVANLETSPHNASTIYAIRNSTMSNMDHVKVSYDNGENWEDITNNLPDIKVRDILVSPLSSNTLYLATELGMYISEDAGECWQPYNFNLPIVEVYDVDFSPADQSIRIATMGRGVWKTSALPVHTNDNLILDDFELLLYPNPTASSLHLNFELQRASEMKISLLNANGQRIESWIKNLNSGENSVELNLEELSLASGTYFLRLEADGMAIHRRVLIL